MIPIYRMLKVLVLGGSLLLLGILVVLNADGHIAVQVMPGVPRTVGLSTFLFFYAAVLWALALLFALFDRLERRSRRSRMLERLRALEQEVEALRKLPLLDRLGEGPDSASEASGKARERLSGEGPDSASEASGKTRERLSGGTAERRGSESG